MWNRIGSDAGTRHAHFSSLRLREDQAEPCSSACVDSTSTSPS
jgi:hypothetical protein